MTYNLLRYRCLGTISKISKQVAKLGQILIFDWGVRALFHVAQYCKYTFYCQCIFTRNSVFQLSAYAALVFFCIFTAMKAEQIFSLLDKRREDLGLTKSELGQIAFDNPKDTSLQNIRRGSMPSFTRVARLAEVLGLECYVGAPREISERPRSNHETIALLDDFAFVKRFDVRLSAGPGSNGDNARELAPVAFRRDWLSAQGLSPDRCAVTGVSGNSMEPVLFDGDLVLLNRNKTDLKSGQIYGIVDVEGDVRIKRIERIDEGLILRSENPDCPSELRQGEDANRVRIIGSLAWVGHSFSMLRGQGKNSPVTTFKHQWL